MSKQDELDYILEKFYRDYVTDMAAVMPPIGKITDIEEQQRQSGHFWNKRLREAKKHISKYIEGLIPEKKLNDTSSLGLDQIEPEHHERNGYNQAIDEISRRAGIGENDA